MAIYNKYCIYTSYITLLPFKDVLLLMNYAPVPYNSYFKSTKKRNKV